MSEGGGGGGAGPKPAMARNGQAPKFQRYFIQHGRYTAGMSVKYEASTLTGEGNMAIACAGF